MRQTQRIALLGFGAIGQSVARLIAQASQEDFRLVSVLVRSLQRIPGRAVDEFGPVFTEGWEDLASKDPDVLVEAAGAEAVCSYALEALSSGMDVVIASVGALADDELLQSLKRVASQHGKHILVPAGAIGGLDALGAASLAGLDKVNHVIRKPPRALLSSKRATRVESCGEPLPLFEGSARESVATFPENTNVTAAVSLAGVGFDRTVVRVIADPHVSCNTHEVVARGEFGEFTLAIQNIPFSSNPRTSRLAALSVVNLLLGRASPLTIGGYGVLAD